METKDKFMDGFLKENLDSAKGAIRKDWDMVFIVDGMEGSGKSVIAQQMALYCDPNLTVDSISFSPDDFKEKIYNAKQYSAVVYDEAFQGLNSRSALTGVNKSIVSMLAEIRQKNLFIFIVLPSFFDLDKNVALWRARALIHVYTGDNFKRGMFSFYSYEAKKYLYVFGKKHYDYGKTSPDFHGKFPKGYVVDEHKYREMKRQALKSYVDDLEPSSKATKATVQRDKLICELLDKGMTQTEVSKLVGLDQSRISQIWKKNLGFSLGI